jgi:hypothetical protein
MLVSMGDRGDATARVLPGGQIEYDGDISETPSAAATRAKDGSAVNGWEYWYPDIPGGLRPLAGAARAVHRTGGCF